MLSVDKSALFSLFFCDSVYQFVCTAFFQSPELSRSCSVFCVTLKSSFIVFPAVSSGSSFGLVTQYCAISAISDSLTSGCEASVQKHGFLPSTRWHNYYSSIRFFLIAINSGRNFYVDCVSRRKIRGLRLKKVTLNYVNLNKTRLAVFGNRLQSRRFLLPIQIMSTFWAFLATCMIIIRNALIYFVEHACILTLFGTFAGDWNISRNNFHRKLHVVTGKYLFSICTRFEVVTLWRTAWRSQRCSHGVFRAFSSYFFHTSLKFCRGVGCYYSLLEKYYGNSWNSDLEFALRTKTMQSSNRNAKSSNRTGWAVSDKRSYTQGHVIVVYFRKSCTSLAFSVPVQLYEKKLFGNDLSWKFK